MKTARGYEDLILYACNSTQSDAFSHAPIARFLVTLASYLACKPIL
jgi:hypothetical protein